jgi:hypothetical protein
MLLRRLANESPPRLRMSMRPPVAPTGSIFIQPPSFIYETLECLGGTGYVEDLATARLYREAPLNAIWEGARCPARLAPR